VEPAQHGEKLDGRLRGLLHESDRGVPVAAVKLAMPLYLMPAGSHISTPMCVLLPAPPQCQPLCALPGASSAGRVM
jgi:hypothetical protein